MGVKPALTAEEWAEVLRGEHGADPPGYLHGVKRITDERCHGMAAACLHGQEYGFTRTDVERHLGYAEALRAKGEATSEMETWHDSMAARIEALLPPEEG